jgi:hypothetical protein
MSIKPKFWLGAMGVFTPLGSLSDINYYVGQTR